MKKRIGIIGIVIFLIISLILLFYDSNFLKKDKTIPTLAMYIKENDTYRKYSGKELILDGYRLNYGNSHCYDKDGNEQTPVRNYLSVKDEGILLSSAISLSCELYFDPKSPVEAPTVTLKNEKEYTNSMTNTYTLTWPKKEGEVITSYCLTEEEDYANCNWQNVSNNTTSIEGSYTFINDINGSKLVFAYLKNNQEIISDYSETTIIFDNVNPVCGSVTKTSTGTSGVSGNVGCSDTLSGCEQESYTFSYLTSSQKININDKAGNTVGCDVSVSSSYTSGYYTKKVCSCQSYNSGSGSVCGSRECLSSEYECSYTCPLGGSLMFGDTCRTHVTAPTVGECSKLSCPSGFSLYSGCGINIGGTYSITCDRPATKGSCSDVCKSWGSYPSCTDSSFGCSRWSTSCTTTYPSSCSESTTNTKKTTCSYHSGYYTYS